MRNCIAKSICYMAPTPTHYLSPYWLWLRAFVPGSNLFAIGIHRLSTPRHGILPRHWDEGYRQLIQGTACSRRALKKRQAAILVVSLNASNQCAQPNRPRTCAARHSRSCAKKPSAYFQNTVYSFSMKVCGHPEDRKNDARRCFTARSGIWLNPESASSCGLACGSGQLHGATVTMIDCYRVLLRSGPTGGNLEDVATKRTMVAGTDRSMPASPRRIRPRSAQMPYLQMAAARGLGSVDFEKLQVKVSQLGSGPNNQAPLGTGAISTF